jgi:hypothetical protein
LEILCHPHESGNKVRILPNRATETPAHDPVSRIPKTFRRTPMSTKAVTEAKADLRVPARTSARRPKKPEQLPAQ